MVANFEPCPTSPQILLSLELHKLYHMCLDEELYLEKRSQFLVLSDLDPVRSPAQVPLRVGATGWQVVSCLAPSAPAKWFRVTAPSPRWWMAKSPPGGRPMQAVIAAWRNMCRSWYWWKKMMEKLLLKFLVDNLNHEFKISVGACQMRNKWCFKLVQLVLEQWVKSHSPCSQNSNLFEVGFQTIQCHTVPTFPVQLLT